MSIPITLIPGDGIGPEVTDAVVRIFRAAALPIDWERHDAGLTSYPRTGATLPAELLESILRNKVALKGPVTNLPGVPSRFDDVDLIIVRENTEDLYSGLEHVVVPGVVESLKIITARASTRIARFAFALARRLGRRRVTAIHKANIMKLGDGLFLESVRQVARDYPEIEYDERIVDAACMQLVMKPAHFDVLLLPNLYGDIVSDLCAGPVGGLGVVPGANIGEQAAVFEAVHGSAPDIAGRNVANPTALLLSGLLMLQHLGETAVERQIRHALARVLEHGTIRTPDLVGTATTTEFADAICRAIEAGTGPDRQP